ncbi:MAG TPA: SCO family protein [Pyrinomonadaceae bacterium]
MKAIPNLCRALIETCAPSVLRATLVVGLLFCAVASAHAFGQKASTKTKRQGKAVSAAERKGALVYSCPMHPSVKSAQAGKCPKCGMALRLVEDEPESSAAPESASDARSAAKEADRGGKLSIPDIELLNQDGQKIRFYTDLVKNKIVAINFIFTTCTTICPPLGATFARVQKDLGERVGRDVHFISVSVDPVTDTPERLKAWGEKFRAGAGWTFVTGGKTEIDQLLRALAASASRREDHSPTVLVINDARGTSTRTYGLAKPSQLVKIIEEAIDGTSATAVTSSKE